MNWLKERQGLLNEIEIARDERSENPGYRSMRPEREFNEGKDNKVKAKLSQFLSTYGSANRSSPSRMAPGDSTGGKSKRTLL